VATVFLAAMALPCLADDAAVLRNGFSIRHEHRQIIGIITRLYTAADNSSFVDIPTAEIDHFEALAPEPAATVPGRADAAHLHVQPTSKNPQPALDLNEVVKAASGTYHLDPDLVNSVIRAESGFNVRAVSPKGAQGLMQLMPQTASHLGVQNIFDPQANVDGGSRYLRELLERYNFDLIKALAAYNAGPQRVEQYGGVPPYYETKAYVARIVRDYNKKIAAKKAADLAAKKAATAKSTAKSPSTATALSSAKVQSKVQSKVQAKAQTKTGAVAASNSN
jgi:soluble lytic murein transglycosylase-like protein